MLRALVAVLVLANLGLWAWTQGWLAPLWAPPNAGPREPERLQAQVQPQRVRVWPVAGNGSVPATGAPAAAGAPVSAGPGSSPPAPAQPAASAAVRAGAEPAAAATALPGAAVVAAVSGDGTVCLSSLPLSAADVAAGASALAAAGIAPSRWQRVTASAAGTPPWLVYAGPFNDVATRRTVLAQWRRMGLAVETLDVPTALAPGLVVSRHDSRGAAEVARSALPETVVPQVRVLVVDGGAAAQLLRIPAADAAVLAQLRALAGPWAGAFRPCGDGAR